MDWYVQYFNMCNTIVFGGHVVQSERVCVCTCLSLVVRTNFGSKSSLDIKCRTREKKNKDMRKFSMHLRVCSMSSGGGLGEKCCSQPV